MSVNPTITIHEHILQSNASNTTAARHTCANPSKGENGAVAFAAVRSTARSWSA